MGFTLCAFPTLNFYEVDCSLAIENEMARYLLTMDLKKTTLKIGIIALYFRLTSVFAVNRVRPRRRDFSFAISAQRKSMFPRSVCGKWCAPRQMCVFSLRRDTQAALQQAEWRGDVISPRTGEGHGGSSGCFGPGSGSSRFCRCVSDFTSALKFTRLKYKTSSVSHLHSDLIEPHAPQFLGHLFIWQLVIINY